MMPAHAIDAHLTLHLILSLFGAHFQVAVEEEKLNNNEILCGKLNHYV